MIVAIAPAAVKPADSDLSASIFLISADAADSDDTGPADDSPLWDEMADESAFMDAYEAGLPW